MGKSDKGFVKGTIIGAILGGAAALLLAPKSGKETREDIKGKARSVKHDMESSLHDLQNELGGRINDLKDATRDLKGEAREESQGLIRQAEVLKKDLQISATNMASLGSQAKEQTVRDAKKLLEEGSSIMSELERVTKKIVGSARDKVRGDGSETDQDEE